MKKIKILLISILLTFVFSSCGSATKTSNTFPYTTPDGSFDNSFVVNVSLKPNDLLKKQVDLLNKTNLNFDDLSEVFKVFTSNDLCINKTIATYNSFDKYDYGENDTEEKTIYDIGNFEMSHITSINRNNETFNKKGTLKLVGFEVIENDIKKEETITYNIDDGVYDASVDFNAFKIKEKFDYKVEELNKTNEIYLNESNFLSYLNMTNNDEFIKEFIKLYNEKDYANSYNFSSIKTDDILTTEFTLYYQLNDTAPTTKISFNFMIDNGIVSSTTYLYEVYTSNQTLEKEHVYFQYFVD